MHHMRPRSKRSAPGDTAMLTARPRHEASVHPLEAERPPAAHASWAGPLEAEDTPLLGAWEDELAEEGTPLLDAAQDARGMDASPEAAADWTAALEDEDVELGDVDEDDDVELEDGGEVEASAVEADEEEVADAGTGGSGRHRRGVAEAGVDYALGQVGGGRGGLGKRTRRAAKRAARRARHAARSAAKRVRKGAKRARKFASKQARKASKSVRKGAKRVGRTVEKGAKKLGKLLGL